MNYFKGLLHLFSKDISKLLIVLGYLISGQVYAYSLLQLPSLELGMINCTKKRSSKSIAIVRNGSNLQSRYLGRDRSKRKGKDRSFTDQEFNHLVKSVQSFCPGDDQYIDMAIDSLSDLVDVVDQVVQGRVKVDIVLYMADLLSIIHLDGGTLINEQLNRLIDKNILVINGVKSLKGRVFISDIDLHVERKSLYFAKEVDRRNSYNCPIDRLCFDKKDDAPVVIDLSWNDYREGDSWGTRRDLNLFLEDSQGKVIASSRREQDGSVDAYAWEQIRGFLKKGSYRLRVDKATLNFDSASRLRIIINGNVQWKEASSFGDILAPADNDRVLRVGSGEYSKWAEARVDILMQDYRRSGQLEDRQFYVAALLGWVLGIDDQHLNKGAVQLQTELLPRADFIKMRVLNNYWRKLLGSAIVLEGELAEQEVVFVDRWPFELEIFQLAYADHIDKREHHFVITDRGAVVVFNAYWQKWLKERIPFIEVMHIDQLSTFTD